MTAVADVVVLVDEDGAEQGVADKLQAHEPPGRLHAAISVMVVGPDGRVLLQQRADQKPLFASCWSNSCCTHPLPGETTVAAAERRLREELGLTVRDLTAVGAFVYRAVDPVTGLVEHERDTVLVAVADGEPDADPAEIRDWTWMAPDAAAGPGGAGLTPWAPRVHDLGRAWWSARPAPATPTTHRGAR